MNQKSWLWFLLGGAALYFLYQKSQGGAGVTLPSDFAFPGNPDTDICNSLSPNYDPAACYSAQRTPYTAPLSVPPATVLPLGRPIVRTLPN